MINELTKDKKVEAVSRVSTKLFLNNKEYADFIYKGLRRQLFDCLDRHLRVDEPILIELQEPTKTTDTTMMETNIRQELVLRNLIRCKECRYWRRTNGSTKGVCSMNGWNSPENYYCGSAEQKENPICEN